MKLKDSFKIEFDDKTYFIDIGKFSEVICILENKKIKIENFDQLKFYMDKYSLFDSYFLEKISVE